MGRPVAVCSPHPGQSLVTTTNQSLANAQLPEFQDFDASKAGVSVRTDNATVNCPVKMFDGSDLPGDLSGKLLQLDESTGDFSSEVTFTNSGNGNFTGTVPRNNKQYVIRFKIDSYRNDLPELEFSANEYSEPIEPCGSEGFEIGPDVEDKPLPGAAISSASNEGVDFSNYTKPGKLYVLSSEHEELGEGTRDVMLVGTPGGPFRLELGGTEMKIAVVNKDSSGDLILAQDLTQGTNLRGIHSLLGQSLSNLLGNNFSSSSKLVAFA